MKALVGIPLLITGCGFYFTPDQGPWILHEQEYVETLCVDDGFDSLQLVLDSDGRDPHPGLQRAPAFEVRDEHTVLKNPVPLSFDFEVTDMAWPGGGFTMPCQMEDRRFECDYQSSEWMINLQTGQETLRAANQCLQGMTEPENETCWSRGMSMTGEFSSGKNPTLNAQFVYFLTCMTGANCLLTPGSERCIIAINATYKQ
jgi:hypothetical protein